MIHQYFYCNGIRYAIYKEVTNHETHQLTKGSNIKYGKLPAKEAKEIPRNKPCVDIIGLYAIWRKGWKENINIKAITMIDPVIGWFEITQYNNKIAISIANLVETTCMCRYPIAMGITYDQ